MGINGRDFEIDEVIENIREIYKGVDQGFAMHKALTNIISEFETNFMIDGVVVDEPNIVITLMYDYAKEGLKEVEEN